MLSLDRVSRRFGTLMAVQEVTFSVQDDEIVGVIGPNGAGKSTLFNLIARAIEPTAGGIRFLGRCVTKAKAYEVARLGLARTFQIPKPFRQLTVRENVMLSALRRHGTPRRADAIATEVMIRTGLDRLADAPVPSLTVGLLKKLEVARALATEPVFLLLDEVMAGLTPTEVREMMKLIETLPSQGITVLWVEHVMMAIMTVAHRVLVMHRGQMIADGEPSEVSRNPAVISAYLGEKYAYASR
jgi:branched-chain amino acid transport system ATP-binding protein